MTLWLESKFFEQTGKADLRGSMLPFDLGHDFRPFGLTIDVSHRTCPCDRNIRWESLC